jgi:hypothetical protein
MFSAFVPNDRDKWKVLSNGAMNLGIPGRATGGSEEAISSLESNTKDALVSSDISCINWEEYF